MHFNAKKLRRAPMGPVATASLLAELLHHVVPSVWQCCFLTVKIHIVKQFNTYDTFLGFIWLFKSFLCVWVLLITTRKFHWPCTCKPVWLVTCINIYSYCSTPVFNLLSRRSKAPVKVAKRRSRSWSSLLTALTPWKMESWTLLVS